MVGHRAYVSQDDGANNGMYVYEFSDTSIMTETDIATTALNGNEIDVYGQYAFLIEGSNLSAIDVSDSTAVVREASVTTIGSEGVHIVTATARPTVSNGIVTNTGTLTAYITNVTELVQVDISDATSLPASENSAISTGLSTPIGLAYHNDMVFVCSSANDSLVAF